MLTAPEAESVKLLMLVRLPMARTVEPLLSMTLLTAPLAVEPDTLSEPIAFEPVRLSVDVSLAVEVARVVDKLLAVMDPLDSLIR